MIGRLSSRLAFERVRDCGRSARSGPLRLRYVDHEQVVAAAGEPCTEARIGFALTRALGTAVVRNRQRRRLREIFRALDREQLLPVGEYVVALRPEGAAATHRELEIHVRNALQMLATT